MNRLFASFVITIAIGAGSGCSSEKSTTTSTSNARTTEQPASTIAERSDGSAQYDPAKTCEGIKKVEEFMQGDGGLSDMYRIQLSNNIAELLTSPPERGNAFDDAAISKICPAEYAAFLRQAEIGSLEELWDVKQ